MGLKKQGQSCCWLVELAVCLTTKNVRTRATPPAKHTLGIHSNPCVASPVDVYSDDDDEFNEPRATGAGRDDRIERRGVAAGTDIRLLSDAEVRSEMNKIVEEVGTILDLPYDAAAGLLVHFR